MAIELRHPHTAVLHDDGPMADAIYLQLQMTNLVMAARSQY